MKDKVILKNETDVVSETPDYQCRTGNRNVFYKIEDFQRAMNRDPYNKFETKMNEWLERNPSFTHEQVLTKIDNLIERYNLDEEHWKVKNCRSNTTFLLWVQNNIHNTFEEKMEKYNEISQQFNYEGSPYTRLQLAIGNFYQNNPNATAEETMEKYQEFMIQYGALI